MGIIINCSTSADYYIQIESSTYWTRHLIWVQFLLRGLLLHGGLHTACRPGWHTGTISGLGVRLLRCPRVARNRGVWGTRVASNWGMWWHGLEALTRDRLETRCMLTWLWGTVTYRCREYTFVAQLLGAISLVKGQHINAYKIKNVNDFGLFQLSKSKFVHLRKVK